MNKIVVVDYGMGNLRSVAQALRAAAPEADVQVVDRPEGIRAADRVVLPVLDRLVAATVTVRAELSADDAARTAGAPAGAPANVDPNDATTVSGSVTVAASSTPAADTPAQR